MRITEISVHGLFGIFDHSVPVNTKDRITIIFGPNGYGKTYTLRLVDALMNGRVSEMSHIPFKSVSVAFDSGEILAVNCDDSETISYVLSEKGREAEVISPEKLQEVVSSYVPVRLINTQRLMQLSDVVDDRRTVNDYSDDLKRRLRNKETDEKIGILLSIVNERFVHKSLKTTNDRGFVVETSAGATLRPDQLSSGEQHLIVLLYDLLFTVTPDSFILIDEPELSLHVHWQQQFVADLMNIIDMVGFDILIATHSPQIIHDRWDLAVELRGPDV